ncbi:MAG: ribonuclease Y [bacterium]|nr:ribonuclease Y [bacterium]
MNEALFIPLIGGIVLVGVGAAGGYAYRHLAATHRAHGAEQKAEAIMAEAKRREREFLLKAKDKGLKIIDDAKREETERRKELQQLQQRLEQRETKFDGKLLELEEKQTKLDQAREKLVVAKDRLEVLHGEEERKLAEIAQLSRADAELRLLANVETQVQDSLMSRVRKLEAMSTEEIERRAHIELASAMQRVASSHSVETTTTSVKLPSDDMKGRIIGKEGRNIKAIEHLTGCEIVVDETPMTITISGFSPVRRQVARRALEDLIKDGRIHPARVEEAVATAKKDLASDIKKAGEDALYELGIAGVDPKLAQILGRLKYRTSYGQNVLHHSIEVANLAGLMAAELKQNVREAKLGGLMHDIGKAVDHDIQGTHIEIGYNILKKFNMPEEVCYAPIAHHEDKPTTVLGCIIKSADAMSGARPGARKDSYENYLKRLTELESVATSFEGIERAYAIQAGREIRIFISPKIADDYRMYQLAKDVAQKIEQELTYPGEIKVTAIRESRAVEYAR